MSKRVIGDVNPSYGRLSGNVSSINQSYTTVADLSDITDAKRELNETINEVKRIFEKKIASTNERINQIDSLPGDIRSVIETTNNQQAILLRKVYRDIADNLAKQQQALEVSCTKANGYIQQLNKKQEKAEQIYSRILNIIDSLSAHTTEIASLKKKIKWLYVLLVSLSVLIGYIIYMMSCITH